MVKEGKLFEDNGGIKHTNENYRQDQQYMLVRLVFIKIVCSR